MKVLVTGGAGFIGSALIRYLIADTDHQLVNVDKLTYAGNLESLKEVAGDAHYCFERVDIVDRPALDKVFEQHAPDAVMHLAAESHVDRSISGPADFVETNLVGTYNLLEAARQYWDSLGEAKQVHFRFHHVSTDEVYGDLEGSGDFFTEQTRYAPSSPYSATKAGSDHLVRAWQRTYGLPTLITNCSNNYGSYHFPEKLIPLTILNALDGKLLPVYGKGEQVRDWLYVEDHARALYQVLQQGQVGETYNIGGYNEKRNIDVVEAICELLERLAPDRKRGVDHYRDLIKFVEDRPGHDRRYAIDASKIGRELGWRPQETFESGLRKTVQWYLDNPQWVDRVRSGEYQQWIARNYAARRTLT